MKLGLVAMLSTEPKGAKMGGVKSHSPEGSCREGITVPKIDRNRRAFLANSFSLAAGAGIIALGLPRAHGVRADAAEADTPVGTLRRLLHHRAQALQVARQ